MANWYGTSRSNWVECVDRKALDEALEGFSLCIYDRPDGKVMFFGNADGGWPSWRDSDDQEGEDEEFDPEIHLMPYIREGEVLVMMQSGAEKLRYVDGHAQAFIREGQQVKRVAISLDDIYAEAESAFGVAPTKAEY